jgi:hypothetical protein
VNGWVLACLAAMALALVTMAIAQAALALQIARVARQALETTRDLRRDMAPLVDKLHKVADDASQASALLVVQVERVDQMLGSAAVRVDETLTVVQDAIVTPIRNISAIVAGLRAAFSMFRGGSGAPRYAREDEEALFIG